MKRMLQLFVGLLAICSSLAASAGKPIEVTTTLDDVFRIEETDQWNVKVERELILRFTDVRVDDKRGYPFSLMLYFKADTPDIAQFDTPAKIERAVQSGSQKYLPYVVEKTVELRAVPNASTYGSFTVLTDAEVAAKEKPGAREFKYMTRGMVRLSKHSVLGFSLLTHDTTSADYRKLMDYVYSFVKPGAKK